MKTIFDIGMYDASDTEYYLSEGHKVIAVEANPKLVDQATERFESQIAQDQLVIVNAAVSNVSGQDTTLYLSGDDMGSSSIDREMVATKNPSGSFTVQSIAITDLIEIHGVPHFLKIDIEGADRSCILPLTHENRPSYLSFEVGDDVEELIDHLCAIGFEKFKAINQINFLELGNQQSLSYRSKRKLIRWLGYKNPRYVRRSGRWFLVEHSAGPAPWVSDGAWQTADGLMQKWREASSSGELGGWYDIHAM